MQPRSSPSTMLLSPIRSPTRFSTSNLSIPAATGRKGRIRSSGMLPGDPRLARGMKGQTFSFRWSICPRGLPFRLPFGNEAGDFEVEGVPSINLIVALKKPTETIRPPTGGSALWRLISHLALNYLSLVEEGADALKEILRLYNLSGLPELEKQIDGITKVNSQRRFARVVSENGISFVRGTQVEIEFDEENFVGG